MTQSAAKLSPVPTAEELEAAAALNGDVQVVGGSLIAGGVQFGTYRDGVLVAADDLAQKVDYVTGKLLNKAAPIEGAPLYVAAGKEPVKTVAKKQVRTKDRTEEEIAKANAMDEEEAAAQKSAEEAAANPPPAEAQAKAPAQAAPAKPAPRAP